MLVSHGMQVVKQLADRALWLEGGAARMEGPGPEVVEAYLETTGSAKAPSALEDF
jgi:ABC-type polysaccharide/polyol phosphate transport system ATPase subunit